MSLHTAAKYLQSHGRGPDDQLVHMSSREVRGLQALAKASGGSLSINPKTGLAEAGFLDAILPTVIGAGLAATGVGAPMAALMVGGGYGLITGDLNKGLMAGLGAYGGAGLGEGLMAAGSAATPLPAAGSSAATTAGGTALTPGVDAGTQALGAASGNAPVATTQVPYGAPATGQVAPTATQAASGTGATQGATGSTWDNLKSMGRGITNLGEADARKAAYAKMPTGTLPALGVTAYNTAQQINQPEVPEQEGYDGPLSRYRLSKNFQPYTAPQPNPYYRPTGLGYAAGGDIMMAAGGSYDDEPMGDTPSMASGGIAGLGGYSDGGRMLKGPGDGMSDSIPASIGGKQPARLADGEFVVPADVVSHLGNGSTDAGAKRLYSMMDNVRKARTGKKKQAPAVKANKYIPV